MSVNKDISSLSYTNKDFGSIYPEMLDLAKELTNKWDPSQSNESDPGVVLIKEGAFVADHNNYNIDKNVLENFLPSATQDRSVRNITEMNGYTPRYYVSANGEITFVWNQPEDDASPSLFSIPAFTLVVSDSEETVSYTQIEDLSIVGSGIPSTCRFIEGTLQTLSINDSSTISLDNLDDNNRLYLPETMVAQNGIYIRNINTDDYENLWSRNNYLLTQPLGSRIYKVDYDSIKMLPYIEFPTDIANLIGDGLQIKYVATSGTQGNVSSNTLTKILSPSTFIDNSLESIERSVENFTLFNAGSITNGKDPETINEMYQSFRRTVGTFDTLVTCKDYDNKIYSLVDNNDNPLVSNVYVTDRRTDYNKAAQVISWDIDNNFKRFKTISTKRCSLHFMGTATLDQIAEMNISGLGSPGDMYLGIIEESKIVDEVETYSDLLNYDTSSISDEKNIIVVKSDETHGNSTCYYMFKNSKWEYIGSSGLYINMSTTSGVSRFTRQDYINLNDFAILTQAMTPFDLVLYAFKAFSMSDYNSDHFSVAYDNSFTPISSSIRDEIKSSIEDVKCISHTWNDPSSNDVYCFKNYVPLNVLITPYNKVTEVEKNEILDNIRRALSDNFNPRHLEFGVKLDVEDLEDAIVSSDSRIRRVDILPLEYHTKVLRNDGKNAVDMTGDLLIDLVAKNVLAGRICLFDFNEDFEYEYGQISGVVYENQTGIDSELYIPLKTVEDEDVVQQLHTVTETTSIQYDSNGKNYKYSFIVDGNDSYSLSNTSGYQLRYGTKDSFTIYELENNKIVKTTTYTSSIDENIEIFNYLDDDAALSYSKGKKLLENSGDILVKRNTNIQSIEAGITNIDYTLNENEAIQIIYPNYYSDTTYSVYVNYRYEAPSNSYYIKANTDHTLLAGEKIIFIYSQNGTQKTDIMYPGEVVNSSIDLIPTDAAAAVGTKKEWRDAESGETRISSFKTLGTNQTISKRKLMTTKINTSSIWCYWIIDANSDNNMVLFDNNVKTRILNNNEYFIYTNASLNELIILGSGTKIERTDNDSSYWTIPANTLTIESIYNTGIQTSIPWKKNIDFNSNPFYITEMNVITLGESDNIKIIGWSSEYMPRVIDGEKVTYAFNINGYSSEGSNHQIKDGFSMCNGSIIYTINGSSTTLPALNNFYNIKSRLDINSGSGIEQKLITTLNVVEDESSESEYSNSIVSSQRLYLTAGDHKDVISSDENTKYIQTNKNVVKFGNDIVLFEPTNFFIYQKDGLNHNRSVSLTKEGIISAEFPFFVSNISASMSRVYMIPIHITGSEVPVTAEFIATNSAGDILPKPRISDYNISSEPSDSLTLAGNNSYYFVVSADKDNQLATKSNIIVSLKLSWPKNAENENETIIVDDITIINGLNNDLKDTVTLKDVLSRINSIISESDKPSIKPYYPYRLDNSIAMNTVDFKDAYSMWDKNNIANKMTIAQIDLQNSVMEIVKDMRNGSY